MNAPQVEWTVLTRRTQHPKLTWIMQALDRSEVAHRLNGESFHAPILEVDKAEFDLAWKILAPVDSMSDDDSLFLQPLERERAWWTSIMDGKIGSLVGAIGILANKVRRAVAKDACCVPEGASPYDCPFATGVISTCPKSLYALCAPMVRLEVFCLALAPVLHCDDGSAIRMCEALIQALEGSPLRGRVSRFDFMASFCHAVAQRLTDGQFEDLVKRTDRSAAELVAEVVKDLVIDGDVIMPKKFELDVSDLLAEIQQREGESQ